MKKKGIFKQLILNIVIPAMIALVVLGLINFNQTRNVIEEYNQTKNRIINNEIVHILEYRELSFELLENEMNDIMQYYSNSIVSEIGNKTNNIKNIHLENIKKKLGMNENLDDIYVIDKNGIIVNSTFKEDLGLDLFSFGEDHKKYLHNVLKGKKFVSERFTIEAHTKRLRKYSYQPTKDDNYIIEIGSYSHKADSIMIQFNKRLSLISEIHKGILAVDLYIGSADTFALNTGKSVDLIHKQYLRKVFKSKMPYIVQEFNDEKQWIYHYEYMKRRNTDLYEGSVLCIISDWSKEKQLLNKELINFILVFILTISILLFLIYKRARVITSPIKKLVMNVARITKGDLSERAEVEGNNEITTLTIHFNQMIEQLESYTNELEQKVKERTKEIEQQKEEIETQRDSLAEQRKILEDTNKSLEAAYNNIEDSIRYARRIQDAILPPDTYVKKLLPDSFFLYLPKDIVSGDFYWIANKDDIVYVAAVDCTGHGVPGAFMSIVGNDQLNYAINVIGARRPDHILNELNKGVIRTLRHDQIIEGEGVRDGMDLAICAFNFKKKTLDYAGAYNPLILIRDEQLQTIKADRFPIGYDPDFIHSHKYTNHHIKLKKGDAIYIFSDGYADQFGGPNKKKFLLKNFRNLLMKIHNKDIKQQKKLLKNTIIDWIGNGEQIDDILVFGTVIK